jgi:probable HAF family extracellular repeat protein
MNRSALYGFFLPITFALLLMACGGGSPPAEGPTPPGEEQPATPPEEPPPPIEEPLPPPGETPIDEQPSGPPIEGPPSTPVPEPPSTPIEQSLYTFTDLGVLEGYADSEGAGINDLGQIVGEIWPITAITDDGFPIWSGPRAFLWEGETLRDLGMVGAALDINAGGQVIGYTATPGRAFKDRAFLWQGGTMTELGHLGGEDSRAEAINDAGQVAGASRTQSYDPALPDSRLSEDFSATLWELGRVRDLNQLADTGGAHLQWAYDINNRSQIIGRALRSEGRRAFLLSRRWEGLVTRESGFDTVMELGGALVFDYWADFLPDGDSGSPFTIEVMVLDAFGNWSLLGQVEEQASSAAWKTAFVQVPENLIGTNRDISLQLSAYHDGADPMIFVREFRFRQ